MLVVFGGFEAWGLPEILKNEVEFRCGLEASVFQKRVPKGSPWGSVVEAAPQARPKTTSVSNTALRPLLCSPSSLSALFFFFFFSFRLVCFFCWCAFRFSCYPGLQAAGASLFGFFLGSFSSCSFCMLFFVFCALLELKMEQHLVKNQFF
jgi:hypothetical protein